MEKCIMPGCENDVKARGVCAMHYRRWRLYCIKTYGKTMKLTMSKLHLISYEVPPTPTICVLDGCEGKPDGLGLCQLHYSRWRRYCIKKWGIMKRYTPEYDYVVLPVGCKTYYVGNCIVEGCDCAAYASGLCVAHDYRWRRYAAKHFGRDVKFTPNMISVISKTPIRELQVQKGKICAISRCDSPATTDNMCRRHYSRWYRICTKVWGELKKYDPIHEAMVEVPDGTLRQNKVLMQFILLSKDEQERLILWLVENFTNITLPKETKDFTVFKPIYKKEKE